MQIAGPPRVWVECDEDEKPVNAYTPPRGDTPQHLDPTKVDYLPWEGESGCRTSAVGTKRLADRHLHPERSGPNVVFYKCVPQARDQRSENADAPPPFAATDVPPTLVERPPQTLRLGPQDERLTLRCSATGSPTPHVVWLKVGEARAHNCIFAIATKVVESL